MPESPTRFGDFLLLKRLGRGATAEVFLACAYPPRPSIPTPVVIKRFLGERSNQVQVERRFHHEAQMVARIRHPRVVRLYESGCVDDRFYIAFEYIEGWPLSMVLQDLARHGTRTSVASVIEIAVQCLEGLDALHNACDEQGRPLGIVHRDLAPKNVMIGEDGGARLIDLGVGYSNLKDWKTRTGTVLGTPGYMAPEQAMGKEVDHRADLYTVGVILFELLTVRPYIPRGTLPEMLQAMANPDRTPPARYRSEIHEPVDQVVQRALSPDPADRFQSASEFIDCLRAAEKTESEAWHMRSLLEDDTWCRLASERTEVTRLVGVALAEDDEVTVVPTVVDRGESETLTNPGAPDTLSSPGAPATVVTTSSSSSRFATAALVISLLALAGTALLARRDLGKDQSPAPTPTVVSESPPAAKASPEVKASPSAKASPTAIAPPGDRPPPTPDRARKSRPRRRPKPPPATESPRPRLGAPPPAATRAAPARSAESGRERVVKLIKKVSRLRRMHPEGSERRQEADAIYGALIRLGARPDASRVDDLDARLSRISR